MIGLVNTEYPFKKTQEGVVPSPALNFSTLCPIATTIQDVFNRGMMEETNKNPFYCETNQ